MRWNNVIRRYSTQPSSHKLTCGLEIHAQLKTEYKLFSPSLTSFHATPNSQVSFFDCSLPGTQPVFNWNVLKPAFKAAAALKCQVQPVFSFDRKHYFYADQPAGYQITQHYQPYALNGLMELFPRDGVPEAVGVRIKQIQIEQDTGKSTYVDSMANIDLNRTNTCLIELVTEPDLPSPEAAGIFVKKLQMLLRHLDICTGELESGAMRVDVNVSIDGGERCEIKNLSSISAVVHAIKAEFKRQAKDVESGKVVESETRGWDGKNTWKLRGKEQGVDYRYMPDPELYPIETDPIVVEDISRSLGRLPDDIFVSLLESPFLVPLTDARTMMNTPGLTDYYFAVYEYFMQNGGQKPSQISNWTVHRLWGAIGSCQNSFDPQLIPSSIMGDIVLAVENSTITTTSGANIIKHYIQNPDEKRSLSQLIDEFDLAKVETESDTVKSAVEDLCKQVINEHPDVTDRIKTGKKPKSIKFLVGQAMKQSQNRLDVSTVEKTLKDLIMKS